MYPRQTLEYWSDLDESKCEKDWKAYGSDRVKLFLKN